MHAEESDTVLGIGQRGHGKSVAFFRKVFDWQITLVDDLGLYVVPDSTADAILDGGVFTLCKAELPFLALHIAVDDIVKMAKLVEKHGGHIVESPFAISERSMICLFNEPSGVSFAMIERRKK